MKECKHQDYLITKTFDEFNGFANKSFEQPYSVILDDRGYIRLVQTDDSACLDHGMKLKINFCPMCGHEFQ